MAESMEQILNRIFGSDNFGNLEQNKNTSKSAINTNSISSALDAYTKDNLTKSIFKFSKEFYANERQFCLDNNVPISVIDLLLEKKGVMPKSDMVSFCWPVFSSKEIFIHFKAFLPKSIEKILDELVFIDSMNEFDIEKLIGSPPYQFISNYNKSTSKILNNEWHLFYVYEANYYHRNPNIACFKLSLPSELKKHLRAFYPVPENAILKPIAEKEINSDLKIIKSEAFITQDLLKVIAYRLQDNIKYSNRLKPNVASVNKMRKSLKLQEYYEDDETFGNVRTHLLAMVVAEFSKKSMREDIASQIKTIFDGFIKDATSIENLVITIKGFGGLYDSYFKNKNNEILAFIKQLEPGNWYSYFNLERNILYNQLDFNPITQLSIMDNYLFYENKVDGYYNEKIYVRSHRSQQLIALPNFKGTLFLMATLGLLDIAYSKPDSTTFTQTYNSDYDGVEYIKITPLGEFVLGLKKEYAANSSTAGGNLIFSEDSLIILAEGDISLYEILLKNYAEKITESRFRITNQSFLKDCKSKKELKQKIDIFRQTVSKKLPLNWELFLLEIESKSNLFKEQNNIIVYQIPAQDRDLQRLIAQDKIFKELVIKAESFFVLIKKENLAKFKSRMKDFGFMID
jgi:hypothetical protein